MTTVQLAGEGLQTQPAAQPPRRPRRWRLVVVALATTALGGGATYLLTTGGGAPSASGGADRSSHATGGAATGAPVAAVPAPAPVSGSAGANASGAAPAAGSGNAPAANLDRVEKSGTVTLRVPAGRVPATADALTSLATREGGIVAAATSTPAGPAPSAQVTLKVPAEHFEDTLRQVGALGSVRSEQVSTQDVTSTYVDLAGRLRALQASRATYLTIMSRASTIGEVLAVQQQVSGVEQQIEQVQGQLDVLGDRTTYGTLAVDVEQRSVPRPVPAQAHRNGFLRALEHASSDFVGGVEAIVAALGVVLLVALVGALVAVLARLGWRSLHRS